MASVVAGSAGCISDVTHEESAEGSSSQDDVITLGSSGEGAEGTMTTTTRFTDPSSSVSVGESAASDRDSTWDTSVDLCPRRESSAVGFCPTGANAVDVDACSTEDTSTDHCLIGTNSPGTVSADTAGGSDGTTGTT